MQKPDIVTAVDVGKVLTKAVVRAIDALGISGREAATIIGVSEATVSRMRRNELALDATSKPFELAVLLVRVFRSLDAIAGGEEAMPRAWLRSFNTAFHAAPIARLLKAEGLADVVTYLDARRAPV